MNFSATLHRFSELVCVASSVPSPYSPVSSQRRCTQYVATVRKSALVFVHISLRSCTQVSFGSCTCSSITGVWGLFATSNWFAHLSIASPVAYRICTCNPGEGLAPAGVGEWIPLVLPCRNGECNQRMLQSRIINGCCLGITRGHLQSIAGTFPDVPGGLNFQVSFSVGA